MVASTEIIIEGQSAALAPFNSYAKATSLVQLSIQNGNVFDIIKAFSTRKNTNVLHSQLDHAKKIGGAHGW